MENMMTLPLPLFYFKPTISWIDDDQIFLDAANISFEQHYNCLIFNQPDKALSFFNTYLPPLNQVPFIRAFTESDVFGTYNHYPVNIDIASIKNLLHLPEKLHEIAVLVIDYNMPLMNGLEVCERLK